MMGGALAVCAMAVGSGLVAPIGATIGGVVDMVGVALAVVCLGLLDGA